MKYVVLKNALSLLCVQLPEGFGTKLEIVYFENQDEFDDFLKTGNSTFCQIYFPQPATEPKSEAEVILNLYDGIFIKRSEYFKKIAFDDIMWVEASRSYCYLHLIDKTRLIVTYPMAEIKKKLPAEQFIQPHRSYLVNKHLVNKFIGNMLYIDEQAFPISRKFKSEILKHFLFLDNDTFGKNNLPSGKPNLPSGKKSGTKDENDVISDDEGL